MKYTYAYKTSDGIRHEDSMDASSREEVFAALRRKGIKAIKVVAGDGSRANGELHGVRKRVVFVLVVAAAIAAAVVATYMSRKTLPAASPPVNSSPRHQIYGDPAVMEGLDKGEFATVLPRQGDRMLAMFAQPGRYMCAKGADPRSLSGTDAKVFAEYAEKELSVDHDLQIAAGDSREFRELKQIVNGMRDEMRGYLANGNGTPRSFWRRLNERTAEEMRIYARVANELKNETSHEAWEEKNSALRRLGLRTIPNPNE